MAKKKAQDFGDWYSGREDRKKAVDVAASSHASNTANVTKGKAQDFGEWYTEGANQPYVSYTPDVAAIQERSDWLKNFAMNQAITQAKANAANKNAMQQYGNAVYGVLGDIGKAATSKPQRQSISPEVMSAIAGKIVGPGKMTTKTTKYGYNGNNVSVPVTDFGAGNKTPAAQRFISVFNDALEVPDGGNKSKTTKYGYNTNNWNQQLTDAGERKPNQTFTETGNEQRLAPEMDDYEARRQALDELIRSNRNAKSVSGSYVIDDLLGFSRDEWNAAAAQEDKTVPAVEEMPDHIKRFTDLSSAEIKEKQEQYNENVKQDLAIARNLLQGTFAGVTPSYSQERENLGLKYGIDANDPEQLRKLIYQMENGVIYTDSTGKETTWESLYKNALNRERAEESVLPIEEQAYVASLYQMSSDELEKQFHAYDEENRIEDLNMAQNLLDWTVPWMEYDEDSEVGQARAYLQETYGVDPTDETQLRTLISDLGHVNGNVIYTDSNGRNYTFQDLYYNAENREQFGRMETDEGSLNLLAEGLKLQKQIDMYNAYIVDAGTAAEYTPVITELKHKMDLLSSRLSENGYDMDRMLGYLNTEEAKQRFIMQSQANAAFTEEHPVLANIVSLLLTPMQAAEGISSVINSFGGNPEDIKNYVPPNYYSMEATSLNSTVRGTTSNMIKDEMKSAGFSNEFADLASEVYAGVLSAAQSRMLALGLDALFGPALVRSFGAEIGKKAVEAMSLTIMGSSAASETFRQAVDRGFDGTHAGLTSFAAGINEALFEKLSLDKFLDTVMDPDNLGETLLGMLKGSQLQRLVEGSEEFFTDIANNIADKLINGNMSEYDASIRTYIKNGLEYDDAVNKANTEYLTNLLQSAFGGYIGGGGMGAYALNSVVNSTPFQTAMQPFANAVNNYEQNRAYQNVGQNIINNQGVESLVSAAQQSGNAQLADLASQVAAQQQTFAKPSMTQKPISDQAITVEQEQKPEIVKPTKKQQKQTQIAVGKLAAETYSEGFNEAVNSSDKVLTQAITDELKKRGLDVNDTNISAVKKIINGQELTYDEKYPSFRINAQQIAEAVRENAPQIEKEAAKISEEAFNRVKNVREIVNADYSDMVSNTGKTVNMKTGKTVDIAEISNIKETDGEYTMTLKTKEGEPVNMDDIQFGDSTQAALYSAIRASGVNAEIGNVMVRAFEGKGTTAANNYVTGMLEGMAYGRTNQTAGMAQNGPYFKDLTPSQQNLAIQYGQMENETDISTAIEKISALRSTTKGQQRVGSVDVRSDMAGLNNAQRTGIRAIEMLVDGGALTNNFHFFSSQAESEGSSRRVLTEDIGGLKKGQTAPNGFYDPKTGDIYIDLNAGNAGEGTILFTAAHELTHFVKQWSPNKFNNLAKFLVEQYNGAGANVDALIRNQMRKSGNRLSYDEAYEEMIADSMQTMFTDGDLASKLMTLKQTDKTLFDKIVSFVKKLQTGINKVYSMYEPDSEEGKIVHGMKDSIDRIADMFAEGITAATENFTEVAPGSGIYNISDGDNKGATILSVRDLLDEKSKNKFAGDLVNRFGVTKQEAMDWLNAETSLASIILNPKYSQFLDYIADPDEFAIKQNSDYPQGTVDFSNICAKRRDFTDVMNRILRQFPDHVFAATDLAKIRTIMSQEGMKVPCGLCYVEDRRQLDSIVAEDFINAVQRYREGNNTRADGKPFNPNQLKGLKLMGNDTHTPSIYELISIEGRNKLKEGHPNIEKAWQTFNNARGMQSVRLLLNDAEYKREILKYNKSTVKNKNDHGGLRIYSFSDMEMFHLIDIIQVLTDCSIKGVYVQGYTKVNEYAKAVRNTGEKLNRSLIPAGDLGYHMENGKVVLDYDTVEGIDINSKDFFDSKDNPNIGNITIGINDTQIRAAMTSDFVDMIIPFHTGQSREVLGEKGIAEWNNYKDYQTDKDIATGKTSKHQVNIYTEVLQPMEKAGVEINKRTFVEKFLEVCKENGLTPRFAQFLNTDANGDYVYTEGYHKMLVDFKTFAQTEVGEYLPQGEIRPIFDNEYLTGLLKNYVNEQQTKDAELSKQMPKVIDRITNEIVNPLDVKISARDQTYMDAVNKADMITAQKMVDQAAYDAGYTLSVYHGTGEYFNVFKMGAEGIHLGNKEQASQVAKGRYEWRSKETHYPWSFIKNHFPKAGTEERIQLVHQLKWAPMMYEIEEFSGDENSDADLIAYGNKIDEMTDYDETYNLHTYDRNVGEHVMNLYAKINDPFVINGDIGNWTPSHIASVLLDRSNGINTRQRWSDEKEYSIDGSPFTLNDAQTKTLQDLAEYKITKDDAWKTLTNVVSELGYDGIKYLNMYEGDQNSYSYIALNPSDVKLADPITFDNAGNVIPLNERFNRENEDIRYSNRDERNISDLQNPVMQTAAYKKLDDKRRAAFEKYNRLSEELKSIPSRLPESQWTEDQADMVRELGRAWAPTNPAWTAKYDEEQAAFKEFEKIAERQKNMLLKNEPKTKFHDLGELVPATQDSYEGFLKNDTGTSINTKGSVLVEMSPEEYLRRSAAMFNGNDGARTNLSMQIRQLSRKTIDGLKEKIKAGTKLYTPWLDERGRNGQEGRHRAAAAYELGIDKIPVVYWTDQNRANDPKFSNRDSDGNVLTPEQQEFFKNSKVRDAEGRLLPVYHGTQRADRVGTVFRPDRATSGPMAFFTDSRQIAENYSRDKKDTSTAYDEVYENYNTQFRVNRRGKSISVTDLWYLLSQSERDRIMKAAPHVTFDNDSGNIIYDKNRTDGLGAWDPYLLKMNRGNALKALTETWLYDGNLYGNEGDFLKVLELVGLKDVQYFDPEYREEGVFAEYLNITNPFDAVNQVTEDFVRGFEQWYSEQDASKYKRRGNNADMWDKNNISAEFFAERMRDDIKNGNSHAWTSIPDSMTDYLKSLGYDGIKDLGGKQGGAGHTVYIPFYSEQIKNIDNLNPTTDPDIRFSDRDPDALDTRTLLSNALLETAQNDIERKYIADYQAKIEAMNEEQRKLNEIRAEIKELSFAPGKRDMKHLKELRDEATKMANRINVYDKQLLKLESMAAVKNVVSRERTNAESRIKEKLSAQLTDYRNRVSSREIISRIEHDVKGLRDRLLHPNAKTIIPEAFAKPAAKFLSSIDFGTYLKDGTRRPGKANATREQLRLDLQNLSESIDNAALEAEYGQLDISPDMKEWIKQAQEHLTNNYSAEDTYVLNKMPVEELQNLYKIITNLRTAVNNAGRMYTNMATNVADLGAATIDHLQPLFNRERSTIGAKVYKTLGWDYAQPVTVFDRFGDAGRTVYKGLLNGQKKEARNVQDILDFVETAYTKEEINDWRNEMHEVTINGNKYNIPTSYIQELYCLMKDADARRHIVEGGGIRLDDLTYGKAGRKKTRTFENTMISSEEVQKMLDLLTPRQKEVADSMQEFMDRIGAEWGNEISMKRFGYHAFGNIQNYYPIKTIKQGSEYEAQQKRANIYALLNKSFTKERVDNANNAVIIGDIFKTFSDHMSEMAVYNSWALPVIDAIKWFNYREAQDLEQGLPERSVKDAIRKAYGAERSNPADEYIRRLLESINGQRSSGLSESWAFSGLRMVNRVAVAGNIRVAVQQPFSITRAFELLNPKYVRPMTPGTYKSEYEEMVENSSFGRWKGMGYFDVDISMPLQREILKDESFADRATEKTMVLAEKGDQFTWTTLWHGCKLEAKAKGLTGKAAVDYAAQKFDEIIARTQVVDSVLTKSQWMRSDRFWHRMTSAFMSEPMTSYNALLRRHDEFVRDAQEHGISYARSKNWKKIASSVLVFTLTQAVNALVTAPIDASRDDDDYKTWLEKMKEKFEENLLENMIPTNMMPFLNNITDYAIYGSESRSDLAMYTRVIDLAKQVYQLINSDDLKVQKVHRAFMSGLSAISSVTGLPMSNIMRDAIAIWNTMVGDVLPQYGIDTEFGSWKFQTAADKAEVGYEQFVKAVQNDNTPRATYIYGQMISNGLDNSGNLDNNIINYYRKHASDNVSEEENAEVLNKIMTILGIDNAEEQSEERAAWWAYAGEHPDAFLADSNAFKSYYEKIYPSGIDPDTYSDYRENLEYAVGVDANGDGKADNGTKQIAVAQLIDSYKLTDAQKDLLYRKEYPDGDLGVVPWHTGAKGEQNLVQMQLTRKQNQTYISTVKQSGIEVQTYKDYLDFVDNAKGIDANGDGRADNGTKQAEIIAYIDSLPLTPDQKDVLFLLNYEYKNLNKAPWHKK